MEDIEEDDEDDGDDEEDEDYVPDQEEEMDNARCACTTLFLLMTQCFNNSMQY